MTDDHKIIACSNEAYEVGVHSGVGRNTWQYAALLLSEAGRRLYAVEPDGRVTLPDDLTLDEARYVLELLGPTIAEGGRLSRRAYP